MGFDKDQPGPIVQPARKTTQVNFWMVIAIVIFFVAGGVAIGWFHRHPREVSTKVSQQMESNRPPP